MPRLQRGFAHLTLGAYGPGFADLEARYFGSEVARPDPPPAPLWRGEPVAGKRVLVLPEQGHGDAILMARFLPRLKAMGAHVWLAVKSPLRRLFAGLEGVDRLLTAVPRDADVYIANTALPHLVGMPEDGPPPPPRLSVPEEARARARARLAPFDGLFKVGIVWTGALDYKANHRRSVAPGRFAALAEIPGVQLVSLYKGPAHERLGSSGMAGLVFDACGDDRDFADTAAVVSELDLMITTDTGVVHVAASLGRPVWNLLAADGYWLYGTGSETPWYPTMRLWRQARPGDWDGVFAAVSAALAQEVAAWRSGCW